MSHFAYLQKLVKPGDNAKLSNPVTPAAGEWDFLVVRDIFVSIPIAFVSVSTVHSTVMELFSTVIVVDVTSTNLSAASSDILGDISTADFVAIDQELSGLGNTTGRGKLILSEYYSKLRDTTATRRTISLGVSCFRSVSEYAKPYPESCDPLQFVCSTYNILLVPDEEFEMDGSACRFLVTHGYDLNRWAQCGIRYTKKENKEKFVDELISVLFSTSAKIVFHNGLADLVYFYESFWNHLPKSPEVFSADVADIFHDRLFDTKLICRSGLRWRMHSLEYCFKKAQRLNVKSADCGRPAVRVRHPHPVKDISFIDIPVAIARTGFVTRPAVGKDVCELMYNFGFCNAFKQGLCQHSVERHQMDLVLDVEESICDAAVGTESGAQSSQVFSQVSETPKTGSGVDVPGNLSKATNGNVVDGKRKIRDDDDIVQSVPIPSTEKSLFASATFCPKTRAVSSTDAVPLAQRVGTNHFSIDNGKSYNLDFGLHSAGFDAFMTGYVFATCMAQLGRTECNARVVFKRPEEFVDRVNITGKSEPFVFKKSEHVQCSAVHVRKVSDLRNRGASLI